MQVFYEKRNAIIDGKELNYNQLFTNITVNGREFKIDLKAERNSKEVVVNSCDIAETFIIGQKIERNGKEDYLLFAVCSTFYGDSTVPFDNKSIDSFKRELIYYCLPENKRF